MKRIALIFTGVFLMAMYGFSQDVNVDKLLNQEQTRTQIFNKILNDHQLMTEFINAMHGNDHAMMMMQGNYNTSGNDNNMQMHGNNQMMGHGSNMQMQGTGTQTGVMMNHNNMMNQMMSVIKDNPEVMGQMMERMMNLSENDSTMMRYMAGALRENPDFMNNCINSNAQTSVKQKGMNSGEPSQVNAMNNMPMQMHQH